MAKIQGFFYFIFYSFVPVLVLLHKVPIDSHNHFVSIEHECMISTLHYTCMISVFFLCELAIFLLVLLVLGHVTSLQYYYN